MKMQKRLKKVLVLLVCFAMLLPFSPTTSAANEPTVIGSIAENDDVILDASDSVTEKTDSIVADDTATLQNGVEVVSLREENVKHFDMGNGTYQAIAYSHPVHEQDSEGNWQNIDFSMNLTQSRGVSTYTNSSGTAFAASYVANQPLMSMGEGDTAITMTLLPNINTETMSTRASAGTAAVQAQCTATQTQIQTYADAQAASFSNTLLYENVMPGIDLEYIVDPWTVKENIIVNQRAGQYSYRFKLDMPGMYPALQPDGSVFIYNNETDAKEYLIPAPYMYDAYGEMSFDVSYAISGNNGIYYLTVTADSSWINAEERVFPITIDPSIYQSSQSVNMDTYINEDTPNEARGLYKFFFVGENEVAYIYTPTPELPEGAIFQSAALKLYYFYKDHITTGFVDFTAHRVTDFYWAQESLTWNDVVDNPDYINFGLTTTAEGPAVRVHANTGATSASPKPVSVNITDAVRLWTTGTTNKGIGLKIKFGCPNRSVMFRSTEGHVNYRPVLEYSYHLYTVNLILEYDEAYENIHGGELSTKSHIEDGAEVLEEFFLENFNIVVHYDTANKITTCADNCLTATVNSGCTCEGLSCYHESDIYENIDTCHHTNLFAITSNLEEPDSTSVRMAYIGRYTCRYKDGCKSSHETGLLGVADTFRCTMGIADHIGDGSEITTAIHEMGHMFGAKDHYGIDCPSTADMNKGSSLTYSSSCIYGEVGVEITDPEKLSVCDGCKKTINENRWWYCD